LCSYLQQAGAKTGNRTPEEYMRFTKSTATALMLCVAATATASFANESQDSAASCVASAKQVSAALGTASSQNSSAARSEKQLGLQFCNAGYYHQGVVHYAKAMELLGQKLALAQ
jgi:hypothetical protein